jgi:hypothetical protein
MKSALKAIGLLIVFLIFLSITINGKPVFNYIYAGISPITLESQKIVEDFVKRSLSGTKNYSVKIFDNSNPRLKEVVDAKISHLDTEKITDEDKSKLDDLIREF